MICSRLRFLDIVTYCNGSLKIVLGEGKSFILEFKIFDPEKTLRKRRLPGSVVIVVLDYKNTSYYIFQLDEMEEELFSLWSLFVLPEHVVLSKKLLGNQASCLLFWNVFASRRLDVFLADYMTLSLFMS